jgi:threonine/homoserine/homoserine lactone efflux protein
VPVHVAAFALLVLLLTLTPGADTALVTSATLQRGRRSGFFATLGVSSGLFVHATASAVGLSLLLAQSARAFTALKVAGACYLAFLGARAIWEARKPRDEPTGSVAQKGDFAAFRSGLLTNVLNPKVALFYLTFLPQFIEPGDPVLAVSLALAAIHVAFGIVWLSTYSWLLDRAGKTLATPRFGQWAERVTGLVMILFAGRLFFETAPSTS